MAQQELAKSSGSNEPLRIDLHESLQQSTLDPRRLSSFQRILLTTDGTVTEILEAYLSETINIVKILQNNVEIDEPVPHLNIDSGAQVLLRKVLLRGKTTYKNYIYAESLTVMDHLDDELRDGLTNTNKPLGRLMLENRVETFREILKCRLMKAEELSEYFNVSPESNLITRTYRMFAHRKPLILITETFPEEYFKD